MLRKTITYEDYNGNTLTEDFYFHLSKAELVEMEVAEKGGLAEKMQEIVKSEDGGQILSVFKEIILKAYGVKSADGKRFIKSQDLRDQLAQSEAYSTLFIELATNADAAAEFVNGIVPAGLNEESTSLNKQIETKIKDRSSMSKEELLQLLDKIPE